MDQAARISANPFLLPNLDESWQSYGAFNPCVVRQGAHFHLLYRALSAPHYHQGATLSVSSIGYARSGDPFRFQHTHPLIEPVEDWERFGCEDPRVTFIDGDFYIFYTAVGAYPFRPDAIRVAVARTRDFTHIEERHLVTPFNAKAMALFPDRINGKLTAVLTVDTDQPPAKIALAQFDSPEQMWSSQYWQEWYARLPEHTIALLRSRKDHLEVGAPPVRTDAGWLLVYSYIKRYFSAGRHFGIEAALLDLDDPRKVIGRSHFPILAPETHYELQGVVDNVVFPSGALVEGDDLVIYYGAADTAGCAARINLNDLVNSLAGRQETRFLASDYHPQGFRRFAGNPIIEPRPELAWEARATFNPAAIYEDGRFHIVYRAMSTEGTSVLGYACSKDGLHIDERPATPCYVPRAPFEQRTTAGGSGCEDPRLTRLGERIYLFYTAYDGITPRVAFSSIAVDDFLEQKWHWDIPRVMSPPGVDDKDSCLFPEKINGQFAVFHRFNNSIYLDYLQSLELPPGNWLDYEGVIIKPRKEYWDNKKFGIAAPPIRIRQGWLLFFHRVVSPGNVYKIEAMLLDPANPSRVIAETDATLMEPEMDFEKTGETYNVVFPCGAVLLADQIYLYYGGADKVVGVARIPLACLEKRLGL